MIEVHRREHIVDVPISCADLANFEYEVPSQPHLCSPFLQLFLMASLFTPIVLKGIQSATLVSLEHELQTVRKMICVFPR